MDLNKFGRYTALFSFAIGTFLLLAFIYTGEGNLQFLGLYYIMLAGLWNVFVLLAVIIGTFFEWKKIRSHLLTVLIMLLNIPVVFIYINILDWRENRLPVTFVNETGSLIQHMEIYKDGELIDSESEIEAGETYVYTFHRHRFWNTGIKYTIGGKVYEEENIANCHCGISDEPLQYHIGKDSCLCTDSMID